MAAMLDLARSAVAPMSPAQSETGFDVVSARLGARERRQSRNRRLLFAGVSAVAVLALAIPFLHFRRTEPRQAPLGYWVEGGQLVEGGYLRASDPAGVRVRFVEGTEVRLPSETRGRLLSVDDKGARFAIEQGLATVSVVPRPEAQWLFDAGPFLVTVHGTVFTVDWDGPSERLGVRLEKGLVSVKGPLSKEPIVIRAGQQLSVDLKKKEVWLQEMEVADSTESILLQTNSSVPPTERPQKAATSSEPRTRVAARSWAAALAAGDVDFVLADAERRGLPHVLAHATSESLAALADAARYRRKHDLARSVLLAQRDRFPGSRRAEEAAFLLGRVEEASERASGKASEAMSWYDRYLKESPRGTYASEALGRKMVASWSSQGASAARPLAEDYLHLFPHGTYAGAARALVDKP
jgi:TolA-binding protein